MIGFWILTALTSALAAGLVLIQAARASVQARTNDPTLDVYHRQLAEVADLAERGLIPETERDATHAEAARRLLSQADRVPQAWAAGRNDRQIVLVAIGLSAALALAGYFASGSPGMADQPFKDRFAAWRRADPATLQAPQMAAVLRALAKTRPNDPDAFRFLGLAESASDNPGAANRALRRAVELAPGRADLWQLYGEALVSSSGGEVTPQAQQAFTETLRRDPTSVIARFQLARAKLDGGDPAAGISELRALRASLPANDPRRGPLLALIDQSRSAKSALPIGMEAIRGMVAGLAARLQTTPDDGEGWVRLVRAYAVLGETTKRDIALATARKRFAADPGLQKALDEAAAAEPMS